MFGYQDIIEIIERGGPYRKGVGTPPEKLSLWKKVAMIGPLKLLFAPLLLAYASWSVYYCFFAEHPRGRFHHFTNTEAIIHLVSYIGLTLMGFGLIGLSACLLSEWNDWAKKERKKWKL